MPPADPRTADYQVTTDCEILQQLLRTAEGSDLWAGGGTESGSGAFGRRYVIAHLEQAPLPEAQTGDCSNPPSVDEASWKAGREEYNRTQVCLLEGVRSLTASQLAGVVREKGETGLNHWVAGLLAHEGYHAGQIAYLRSMQGILVASLNGVTPGLGSSLSRVGSSVTASTSRDPCPCQFRWKNLYLFLARSGYSTLASLILSQ